MNLLIEKTATNKYSDIFLRIVHNICKIRLTLQYFSYILLIKCIKRGTTALVLAENDLK